MQPGTCAWREPGRDVPHCQQTSAASLAMTSRSKRTMSRWPRPVADPPSSSSRRAWLSASSISVAMIQPWYSMASDTLTVYGRRRPGAIWPPVGSRSSRSVMAVRLRTTRVGAANCAVHGVAGRLAMAGAAVVRAGWPGCGGGHQGFFLCDVSGEGGSASGMSTWRRSRGGRAAGGWLARHFRRRPARRGRQRCVTHDRAGSVLPAPSTRSQSRTWSTTRSGWEASMLVPQPRQVHQSTGGSRRSSI